MTSSPLQVNYETNYEFSIPKVNKKKAQNLIGQNLIANKHVLKTQDSCFLCPVAVWVFDKHVSRCQFSLSGWYPFGWNKDYNTWTEPYNTLLPQLKIYPSVTIYNTIEHVWKRWFKIHYSQVWRTFINTQIGQTVIEYFFYNQKGEMT